MFVFAYILSFSVYVCVCVQFCIQFYKKYPNMAIVLGVEALKPPVVNFYEKSINATIPGGAIFYVVNSTTSRTEWVFTLSAVSLCFVCTYACVYV